MVMRERKEVKPTHIRVRGNYDQLGDEVTRDTPHFLPPPSEKGRHRLPHGPRQLAR